MPLDRFILPEQLEHSDPSKPLIDDTVIKGSYKIVSTIAERNSIPLLKRQKYNLISINGVIKQYVGLDTSNTNWINDDNWEDLKKLENIVVETIKFNELSPKGETGFDTTNDCLYTKNADGSETQHGQELGKRACTEDATIVEGDIVYVYGSGSGVDGKERVEKVDITKYDTSRVIGMVTTPVVGNCLRYTKFGDVNDLDTSAYTLGTILYGDSTNNGKYTSTRPTTVDYIVFVGVVTRVGVTDGRISVSPYAEPYTVETVQKTAWSNTLKPTSLVADNATRTVTWSRSDVDFVWYHLGVKFSKITDSITPPNEEGLYVFYYDATGTPSYVKNPSNSQTESVIRNYTLIGYAYWDFDNQLFNYKAAEFHAIDLPKSLHVYLHFNFKCRWSSGLLLNTFSADGNGNSNAHAQFGVEVGAIVDEDLYWSTQAVGSTVGLPIYYILGTSAAPKLRLAKNAGYSILTTGTGRMAYNSIGANNTLVEATNNNFVLCHVFGFNEWDGTKRVMAMVGQNKYTTIALARLGASTELKTIQITGLVPSEMKSIGTVVFQTSNTYNNAVKSRVISYDTTTGETYKDWRDIQTAGGSGGNSSAQTEFSDVAFALFDDADPTKRAVFEVSEVPTGATNVYTLPKNGGALISVSIPTADDGKVLTAKGVGNLPKFLAKSQTFDIIDFTVPIDLGNSGATKTIIAITNKLNILTLTDNCILTLPAFLATQSVSFMFKIIQDATGGRTLTINKRDANAAINLSEFDFASGTASQKCWVTVLWDGIDMVFTSSKYFD